MHRDWELLRKILEEVENTEGSLPLVATNGASYVGEHKNLVIPDRDFGDICEHALLLGDSGLAVVRDLGQTWDGPTGVAIDRLTMAGHDFLAGARDDGRWNAAMTTVKEKGGAVTVGVLSQILASLLKQSFGLH